MKVSYPSTKTVLVDVPEALELKAEFRYNFFVPDERINGAGLGSKIVKPSEFFGSSYLESKVPRYVKLTWKPVNLGDRKDLIKISIKENLDKVKSEQTFSSDDFSNVTFQDSGVENKLTSYVKKAIERAGTNSALSSSSPLDAAKEINRQTSEQVTNDLLASSLSSPTRLGTTFGNNGSNRTTLEELGSVSFNARINNKVLDEVLKTVQRDVTSLFSDEVEDLLKTAKTTQGQARTTRKSSVFSGDDYDLEISDYVTIKTVDTESYDTIVQSIGYIIERDSPETLFFVEDPAVSTFVDTKVKYGSTHHYSIKTVAYVETLATNSSDGKMVAIGFLVSSQPSPSQVVTCEERVPPPCPSDFNIAWDYKQQCTRLSWSFPPNTQRDIKKFQVFRRATIRESFQLVKMFDFDDSEVKGIDYNETPDPTAVENKTETFWLDKEFTKSSRFIYAVCSIDAHGFSSGYSMQLEVSFDRFSNKVVKKLISVSGAPKSYPNSFLNVDTFVDTIKDEGHNKLEVVFNPEFLRVYDKQRTDLGLLKTGLNDTYRLQLINIDLQKQQVVDMNLDNRTTTGILNSRGNV